MDVGPDVRWLGVGEILRGGRGDRCERVQMVEGRGGVFWGRIRSVFVVLDLIL